MVSENWKRIVGAELHRRPGAQNAPRQDSVWFEVDPQDLERSRREDNRNIKPLDLFLEMAQKTKGSCPHGAGPKRYVAMDCEMVGIGCNGADSALARISLVDWNGHVLLDSFVKPCVPVTDYRTDVSGVEARHLVDAPSLSAIQAKVAALIDGRVLIGHGLENDLRVLLLGHPRHMRRDSSDYAPLRTLAQGRTPSLRHLARRKSWA